MASKQTSQKPAMRRARVLLLAAAIAAAWLLYAAAHGNEPASSGQSGPSRAGHADAYSLAHADTRASDVADTFARFSYRASCPISSLDLHRPFEPVCESKQDLLTAMSGGGRVGVDAPYMPRGCDMRWFDRADLCRIITKYENIVFVGDSMMRHVVGALHILLREDLGYGAVTQWNFRQDEREACFCQGQFDTLKCGLQGIFNSADVVRFDRQSLKCDSNNFNVQNHVITTHPVPREELRNLADALPRAHHHVSKPIAFIYGHGHHNKLDPGQTGSWLDSLLGTINSMPKDIPRAHLFVTPSATGPDMFDLDILDHGLKRVTLYELGMPEIARRRGVDLLGTVNMTLQTTSLDGKHSDIKANLLKAMMILNWLDKVDPTLPTDPAEMTEPVAIPEPQVPQSEPGKASGNQPDTVKQADAPNAPVKDAPKHKAKPEQLSEQELAAKFAQKQLLSEPPALPAHVKQPSPAKARPENKPGNGKQGNGKQGIGKAANV